MRAPNVGVTRVSLTLLGDGRMVRCSPVQSQGWFNDMQAAPGQCPHLLSTAARSLALARQPVGSRPPWQDTAVRASRVLKL